MNQKLTLSLLGVTLAVVATLVIAPIVSETAYAVGNTGNGNGGNSGNGVNGGSQVTGHDRACENSGAAANNPHCQQTRGGGPDVLRVKPVEG